MGMPISLTINRTLLKSVETYTKSITADLETLSTTTESHFVKLNSLLECQHTAQFDSEKQKVRADILNWISKLDCSSSIANTLQHVLPNDRAGQWLFQSESFKRWTKMSSQRIITLTGNCTKLSRFHSSFWLTQNSGHGQICTISESHIAIKKKV